MKAISLLLVFLLLLNSCSIYHAPTSVEAAVVADKKVRIITSDNQKYKFHRLEMENNRLVGITKLESSTAKKLAGSPARIEGKYLKMDLSHLNIEEINLRNNKGSRLLTAGIIIKSLTMAYVIILLAGTSYEVPTFVSPFPTDY